MGKAPRGPVRLLQRLEALRAFLNAEERGGQDLQFRLASLAARLAASPRRRCGSAWCEVHRDLLALLRELFGDNIELVRTFLPSFSTRFLRAQLAGLGRAPPSPPRTPLTRSQCPASPSQFKEVSLRDLKEVTASTPDLGASRGRKRPESVRLGRVAGRKFEISALSITDISDFPLSQRHTASGPGRCPLSPLPCFSLAQWGAPAQSPRAIIQRL